MGACDACRDAPGGKRLSRVDSMALAANAKSMARMHDSGRVVDPGRDISNNYRPHRGYSGSHHDGGLYAAEVGGSLHAQQVGGSMHRKKSMPRNRSEGALVRSRSLGNRTSPQVNGQSSAVSYAASIGSAMGVPCVAVFGAKADVIAQPMAWTLQLALQLTICANDA